MYKICKNCRGRCPILTKSSLLRTARLGILCLHLRHNLFCRQGDRRCTHRTVDCLNSTKLSLRRTVGEKGVVVRVEREDCQNDVEH